MILCCPTCGMQYTIDAFGSSTEIKMDICKVCGSDLGRTTHDSERIPVGKCDSLTVIACPKCGREQGHGEECIQCGVFFGKIQSQDLGTDNAEGGNSVRADFITWSPIAFMVVVLCVLFVITTLVPRIETESRQGKALSNPQEIEINKSPPQSPAKSYGLSTSRPNPSVSVNSVNGSTWVASTHQNKVAVCMEFAESGTGRRDPAVAAELCTCIDEFFMSEGTRFKRVTEVGAACLVLMGFSGKR